MSDFVRSAGLQYSRMAAFSPSVTSRATAGGIAVVHSGDGDVEILYGYEVERKTITAWAKQLDVTEDALRHFFRIIEHERVPFDDLLVTLSEIAIHYKTLRRRLDALTTDHADVERRKAAAREAIETGNFGEAEKLLGEAEATVAKIRENQRREINDSYVLEAGLAAAQGDTKMMRLAYAEAAVDFQRAVNLLESTVGDGPQQRDEFLADYLAEWGRAAIGAGGYRAAIDSLRKSIDVRQRKNGTRSALAAASHGSLGSAYREIEEYREAEKCFRSAWAIRKEIFGRQSPEVAESLSSLARVCCDQGRYDRAEKLLQRAVKITEERSGTKDLILAEMLSSLARLRREQGRYMDAARGYRRALMIRKVFPRLRVRREGRNRWLDHPELTRNRADLAFAYRAQGRYSRAKPLYERALAMQEEVLGPEHPELVTSLDHLAALYVDQGRYDEAEQLYKRAVKLARKRLGSAHTDTAQSLNNLARVYQSQGRHSEAEPLYLEAAGIYEKVFGPQHRELATTLSNLALLCQCEGRHAEAESFYLWALSIREGTLKEYHPDVAETLNNLAALYHDRGRHGRAKRLYIRVLRIWEKALGAEHPDMAECLNNMARLYVAQGRRVKTRAHGELLYQRALDVAASLHHRALRIAEQAGRARFPLLAKSLNNVATIYHYKGCHAEAEPFYVRALGVWKEAVGSYHPEIATTLQNLAMLHQDQGRNDEAEKLYKEALEVLERVFGAEHVNTAVSGVYDLAHFYHRQGRCADARPLYERALRVIEDSLGPEHPWSVALKKDYAGLLKGIAAH